MSRPAGITYGNGSPYRAMPLATYRMRGCAEGAHDAATTTDRDGVWFWVCLRGCGAERPQGGTWTAAVCVCGHAEQLHVPGGGSCTTCTGRCYSYEEGSRG